MDGLTITLWVATGAFIGGVVTPTLTARTTINDWLAMLLGTVVGAVGNVVLLLPLWIALRLRAQADPDPRPAWQRDAMTLEDAQAALASPPTARENAQQTLDTLGHHFWPAARPAGEHSHRLTYVGVFVALAVVTAIEVVLSVADLGFDPVVPLVVLSTLKVLLVVMFFMHLRYDYRWYSGIFAVSLPFAILVLVVLAASV